MNVLLLRHPSLWRNPGSPHQACPCLTLLCVVPTQSLSTVRHRRHFYPICRTRLAVSPTLSAASRQNVLRVMPIVRCWLDGHDASCLTRVFNPTSLCANDPSGEVNSANRTFVDPINPVVALATDLPTASRSKLSPSDQEWRGPGASATTAPHTPRRVT